MTRRTSVLTVAVAISLVAPPALADARADADAAHLRNVLHQRLEFQRSGIEDVWSNPTTGSTGTITIEPAFERDDGLTCRNYRRTTERVDAPPEIVAGVGCRVEAGIWQVNEVPVETTAGVGEDSSGRRPPVAAAEPPPMIPPPPPKPDRSAVFASMPIPSTY